MKPALVGKALWMERLQLIGGVGGIIGLATYQVLSAAPKRPGMDTFSSEKPEQLRNETKRELAVEAAKVATAAEKK